MMMSLLEKLTKLLGVAPQPKRVPVPAPTPARKPEFWEKNQ